MSARRGTPFTGRLGGRDWVDGRAVPLPEPPVPPAARPDDLREIPATMRSADGKEIPARILTPRWTREELRDLVRGEAERGLLTPEQAERLIRDSEQQDRQRTREGR